jgi:hypothetical protein
MERGPSEWRWINVRYVWYKKYEKINKKEWHPATKPLKKRVGNTG